MSKVVAAITQMEKIHLMHDKAKKVKHTFAFADGSKVMMYRTPPKPIVEPVRYSGGIPERISEADLVHLHTLIASNDRTKVAFRDSLYEKYGVNRLTHRIIVRDGMIESLKTSLPGSCK